MTNTRERQKEVGIYWILLQREHLQAHQRTRIFEQGICQTQALLLYLMEKARSLGQMWAWALGSV